MQQEWEQALDASGLGAWNLDLETGNIWRSARHDEIFGYKETLGKWTLDLFRQHVAEVDRERARLARDEAYVTGHLNIECQIIRGDKSPGWISLRGKVSYDDKGKPVRILGTVEDITERKQLAEQLLRAQRMESIGILAGGIAHDLNNILAPLLMGCDLLVTTSEQQKQLVDAMRDSTKRGAALVQQVLSFARGVEGQRMDLDPRHLLKEIAKIVQTTFPRDIKLEANLSPILWTLNADPTQLRQVLMNLVVNARDAMPKGGILTLTASNVELDSAFASMKLEAREGCYVVITVGDSGGGILPEIREKIFDPFFTTKELGKGTGLGLSTTLGIVKSYGGFITVECEPGAGTCFKVYLPAQTGQHVSKAGEDLTPLPKGHGELILVVDDEANLLAITRGILESNGYRVLSAENGVTAVVEYVQKQKDIALVLTDVMMPVMDGVSTIYALLKINPEVKIIAVSGLGAETQVTACVTAGAKHFLHKPYSTTKLLTTLDQMLHPKA